MISQIRDPVAQPVEQRPFKPVVAGSIPAWVTTPFILTHMWTVYVIASQISNFKYTGMSQNVDRRIKEHNSGKVKSTKAYQPFTLIYSEQLPNPTEARRREKYLKSAGGRRFLSNVAGLHKWRGKIFLLPLFFGIMYFSVVNAVNIHVRLKWLVIRLKG